MENKIRLLEWKGRTDLVMYASRRSPKLLLEEITGYVPKDLQARSAEWKGIFRRLFDFEGMSLIAHLAYTQISIADFCKQMMAMQSNWDAQ